MRMQRREFITLLGGAATAWPLAAQAQQPAMPVIGFLSGSSLVERTPLLVAFRAGLAEFGYIEAKNVTIEYRWAEGQYARFPALMADLLRRQPTIVVAGDAPSALAAKAATSTIPIIFNSGGDPLQIGLVNNLGRPTGNLTGVNLIAGPLPGKQLGLLHELLPTARTIGHLTNPTNANAQSDTATVQEAARTIGMSILIVRASAESDIETAFASLVQARADGMVVNSDVFLTGQRGRIVALAARYSIPTVYPWREFATAGGSSVTDQAFRTRITRSASTRARFSQERSLPICRSSSQRISNWSSTSKRPRPSASPSRPGCSPLSTRSSNEKAPAKAGAISR